MKRKAIEQAQAIDHMKDDGAVLWRTDASIWHGLKRYESKFPSRALANVSIRRRHVNMDLAKATAWFATTAMRLHRLWCPFGEVQ